MDPRPQAARSTGEAFAAALIPVRLAPAEPAGSGARSDAGSGSTNNAGESAGRAALT